MRSPLSTKSTAKSPERAQAIAAARRGLTGRTVTLDLDGGTLQVTWRQDGHAVMTGPVATAYNGVLSADLLNAT